MSVELYNWVFLPTLVFLARVFDVTLGTMRILFIARGKKYLAPVFGFVEVLVWIAVVAKIVQASQGLASYLAYAAGFAVGNYIGLALEDRLAMGMLMIQVIVQNGAEELVAALRQARFGVTTVDGMGMSGPVKLIYTVVRRRDLQLVLQMIHEHHPHAFLSIEDLRSSMAGFFPESVSPLVRYRFGRKTK